MLNSTRRRHRAKPSKSAEHRNVRRRPRGLPLCAPCQWRRRAGSFRMAKRMIAGVGVLLCLALLVAWRLDLGGTPVAKAQVAPPDVPVVAGAVTAQDVPQF